MWNFMLKMKVLNPEIRIDPEVSHPCLKAILCCLSERKKGNRGANRWEKREIEGDQGKAND